MEKLLTVKEVQNLLGLGRHTVYMWCSEKRIPHIRMGKKVMFSLPAIEKWLEQQSKEGSIETWSRNA